VGMSNNTRRDVILLRHVRDGATSFFGIKKSRVRVRQGHVSLPIA
jgi:hypothetical protein